MASFFDDWNELARNQKSAVEVAADSLQQSVDTLADFKLNKMSIERGIRQDQEVNRRADKRLLLDAFKSAQAQFSDDPVGYHNWTKTAEAQEAGHASGISNWADAIAEAKRDSDDYVKVRDFKKDWHLADDPKRLKDYTLDVIREHKSIATNLGPAGASMANSMIDIENSFKAAQARKFGKDSAEMLYDWAVDKNLLQENTQFAANIQQAIASNNNLLANQLILTELKDKKANESEIMEVYSLQQRISAAQYAADNDEDKYNERNTTLRNVLQSHFGNILDRQLPAKGPLPPESAVLGFEQQDSEDDVVLGATNFRTDQKTLDAVRTYVGDSWSGDPNTLMLGDRWYVGADLNNSGKFKRTTGINVRRASADRLGRVKLDESPESRKKWYAAITSKYQYTDDGKVLPEVRYQKGWKRDAYTSKKFTTENRVMKPIASGDVILNKKSSDRFVVISKSYGPSTGTVEKVIRRTAFSTEKKIYSQYDTKNATVSIQPIGDYEKGTRKNIETISQNEFAKKYGLALLRLPMKTLQGDDPLGLKLF